MSKKIIDLEIYTDGSCKKITTYAKTGFIAFGFLVKEDQEVLYCEVDAIDSPTSTSQRAELLAIIRALEYAKTHKDLNQRVIIYSDSAYAINGLNNWIFNWRANGWRNSNKEEVANYDLWVELNKYVDLFEYRFIKVKGHENNIWNNQIDEMVQERAKRAKKEWRGKNNG